jgi:hypothetical protein
LFVTITLTVVTLLTSRFGSRKGNVLVLGVWDALFVINGLFCAFRPVGWLHFLGSARDKPVSPTARVIIRLFGVFAFLLGVMGIVNLYVNFNGYWNGIY